MESVYSVESVELVLDKSKPPIVTITAVGTVRSLGWSGGTLSAVIYVHQPIDGIQDFTFSATPPAGASGAAMSPITATTKWHAPAWALGVRVLAETNSIEKSL